MTIVAPVCNDCLRAAGRKVRESKCTKPGCSRFHLVCHFCGNSTDGRLVKFHDAPGPSA